MDAVARQIDEFSTALPDVDVYYAIKSNGREEVVETLRDRISGFEIASWGEGQYLRELGVPVETMIYSNPVKPSSHIRAAVSAGVRGFAFDSWRELDKIASCAPGASVYLRLAVGDGESQFPLSSKFGCEPDQAVDLMDRARRAGLNPIGLTFHVGSQCESVEAWSSAIARCGRVMEALDGAGLRLGVLDLGGGFPITYTDQVPDIDVIGRAILDAVDRHLPYTPRLWAEPGRFLAAPALSITTEVIGRETRRGEEWLYIDMGVFQGLMECLEIAGWRYPVTVESPGTGAASIMRTFTVTGPTCDALDTLFKGLELPDALEPGDRLRIGMAGAYTLEYGSTFNGFHVPVVDGAPSVTAR